MSVKKGIIFFCIRRSRAFIDEKKNNKNICYKSWPASRREPKPVHTSRDFLHPLRHVCNGERERERERVHILGGVGGILLTMLVSKLLFFTPSSYPISSSASVRVYISWKEEKKKTHPIISNAFCTISGICREYHRLRRRMKESEKKKKKESVVIYDTF